MTPLRTTEWDASPMTRRLWLGAVGICAGLAGWLLTDGLFDALGAGRVLLALAVAAMAFFGPLLATLGPLRPAPAMLAGAGIAAVAMPLMVLASTRFDAVPDFLTTGHPVVILALLLPYITVALRADQGLRDAAALFGAAWRIAIRVGIALAFSGFFRGLVALGDTLLRLVALTLMGDLLRLAPVPWVLGGLVGGLALAVTAEVSARLSGYLGLRLLRLLLSVSPPATCCRSSGWN